MAVELLCGNAIVRFEVWDPTGNVTALVTTLVPPPSQPDVAACVMGVRPDVEQVGLVRAPSPEDGDVDVCLRMAGGEFCGNASMCAAAWWARESGVDEGAITVLSSGTSMPVEVRLSNAGDGSYKAGVLMPSALAIETHDLGFDGVRATVPVVRLGGIDHVVIGEESAFFDLQSRCGSAESAVCSWCAQLGSDCLGLMFLSGTGEVLSLVPLVHVPGAATTFWESSCASGSSAVGMWLASLRGDAVDVRLVQPGGTLRVTSDPATSQTWLHGQTRQVSAP